MGRGGTLRVGCRSLPFVRVYFASLRVLVVAVRLSGCQINHRNRPFLRSPQEPATRKNNLASLCLTVSEPFLQSTRRATRTLSKVIAEVPCLSAQDAQGMNRPKKASAPGKPERHRRSHLRTFTGCQQCRQRHVKCEYVANVAMASSQLM